MPARPIAPERQTMLITAAAVLVLTAAMVMAAGCTQEKSPQQLSVPHTIATPTIALSDRELAEQAMADARGQIDKTDGMISWFRGNASTRNDPLLPAIITKREVAVSYLSIAQDEISNGNYGRARYYAIEAFRKADESYNDARYRQERIVTVISPPACEQKLPFDKTICILLVSLVPVLLTALVCSLEKANPAAGKGRLRRFMGTATGVVLFIGISVIFSVLVIGAKVAYVSALRPWLIIALLPWVCLMLALSILSVIAIGYEMIPLVRSIINTKPHSADPDAGDRKSFAGIIWPVTRMIVTILLVFTMPLVLHLGLLLASPLYCL